MALKRPVFACAILVLALVAQNTQAGVEYRYEGNFFDLFSCGGDILCSTPDPAFTSYTTADFVRASITLDEPLASNLQLQDVTGFPGFSLTTNDGQQELTFVSEVLISTDTDGKVIAPWSVIANCCAFPNNGIATLNWPGGRGISDFGTLSAPNGSFPDTPRDQALGSVPGTWGFTVTESVVQYNVSYDGSVVGPSGTGSFQWDDQAQIMTNFVWDFGAGKTGGIPDSWLAQFFTFGTAAGTGSQAIFELLTGQDVLMGGALSAANLNIANQNLFGAFPVNAAFFPVTAEGTGIYEFEEPLGTIAAQGRYELSVTILESATLGPSEFGGGLAIGISVNNEILGNRFSISEITQITAIGGHLDTFDGVNLFNRGSIWGAIIPMSGFLPAFDASEVEANALVHAIFEDDNPASGDLREPVSLVLNPGDYALLFGGGGLFGTTGAAIMATTDQVRLPGFSVFFWDGRPGNNIWRDGGTDQAPRFVVEGSATTTGSSVPADDCTATAGGCNPTGVQEIVLPDNFVVPPGGTITQTPTSFVDPRADQNGRCDGQTALPLLNGDLIIPPHLCGSPEFEVLVTEANFEIQEGTVLSTMFPEEFVSNPLDCNRPIIGDPQLQDVVVWQPDDSADVIEGRALELTFDCGSSRGRTRGLSFFVVGMHIDFGLDFDQEPQAVTQAFIDLTSVKIDSLLRAVNNAALALREKGKKKKKNSRAFYRLRTEALNIQKNFDEGQYDQASRTLEIFLQIAERADFDTGIGFNHQGNLISRASNIKFTLDEKIVPFVNLALPALRLGGPAPPFPKADIILPAEPLLRRSLALRPKLLTLDQIYEDWGRVEEAKKYLAISDFEDGQEKAKRSRSN